MQQRIKRSIAKGDKKRRKEYENLLGKLDVLKKKFALQTRVVEITLMEIKMFLKNYFAANPLTAEQCEEFNKYVQHVNKNKLQFEHSFFNNIMLLYTSTGVFEKIKPGAKKIDNECDRLRKEYPDNIVPIQIIDNLIKELVELVETYKLAYSILLVTKTTSAEEIAFIKEHYNDVFVKYSVPELQN